MNRIMYLSVCILFLNNAILHAEDCPGDPHGEGGGSGGSPTSQSYDPNQKVGPAGSGDPVSQRYLIPGVEIPYIIYFENKPDASAPAQEVRVTDDLSQSLDWSTFKVDEVVFGNQVVEDLSGKIGGTVELNQAGSDLRVRIQASINTETGKASWYLRTVDPATEDGWPADPQAGFLPPDDGTHRGEGHVSFTIKAKSNLATNTRITNKASVVFDYNAPIDTNEVFNTIVADAPQAPSGPNLNDGARANPGIVCLDWAESPFATEYDIYVWRAGQARPTQPVAAGILSTFYLFNSGPLGGGASWCWQVVAKNGYGQTTGDVWSFNVGDRTGTRHWSRYR